MTRDEEAAAIAAERWAAALADCRAAERPCGWCLWRHGYRVPDHLRARRSPRKFTVRLTMSDEQTEIPTITGSTEIRIGEHATKARGHLTPSEVARVVGLEAARSQLPAGTHDVTWWHVTEAGVPVGRARTRTLALVLVGRWA